MGWFEQRKIFFFFLKKRSIYVCVCVTFPVGLDIKVSKQQKMSGER